LLVKGIKGAHTAVEKRVRQMKKEARKGESKKATAFPLLLNKTPRTREKMDILTSAMGKARTKPDRDGTHDPTTSQQQ